MKAVVKTERAYGKIEVSDVPLREVGPGEALIRVRAAGVCGSDVSIYKYTSNYSHIPIPIRLGHEYAGVVEQVGPGVTGWKPGERVMGEAIIPCDKCRYCRTGQWEVCANRRVLGVTEDGTMSEYAVVPETILHQLPGQLDFTEAVVAQPCAVAIHGIERTPLGKGGENVAVFGAGIIGLSAALAAREFGAKKVVLFGIDVDKAIRLPAARTFGLEAVNLGEEAIEEAARRTTGGADNFDVVLECSGSEQAFNNGLPLLRNGGTLMEIGMPAEPFTVDMTKAVRKQVNILTSYSANWHSYERALQIINSNKEQLAQVVSKYPLEKLVRCFDDSTQKKVLKSVLLFS